MSAVPSPCRRLLLVALCLLLPLGAARTQAAIPPSDGERAWQAGHQAALRGLADSALTAYGEALRLARQDRDSELASAARLGMAEVWDVWRRCRDSARVAYEDAVRLTSEGDYAAADAYVLWLARQGDHASARALHARTYAPIENEVPRTITRESVNFLIGISAIQVANSSRSGALMSLQAARDVAARLAVGDAENPATETIRANNFWILHDLATLYLDPTSKRVHNPAAGTALRRQLDAATVSEDGEHPRFAVGRLADRVARARRTCTTAACKLPPPPPAPRCR